MGRTEIPAFKCGHCGGRGTVTPSVALASTLRWLEKHGPATRVQISQGLRPDRPVREQALRNRLRVLIRQQLIRRLPEPSPEDDRTPLYEAIPRPR